MNPFKQLHLLQSLGGFTSFIFIIIIIIIHFTYEKSFLCKQQENHKSLICADYTIPWFKYEMHKCCNKITWLFYSHLRKNNATRKLNRFAHMLNLPNSNAEPTKLLFNFLFSFVFPPNCFYTLLGQLLLNVFCIVYVAHCVWNVDWL